jgi:hypothetical protein
MLRNICNSGGGGGGDAPSGPSSVLVLDPSNFDTEIGGEYPALVEFFAPVFTSLCAYVLHVAHIYVCIVNWVN